MPNMGYPKKKNFHLSEGHFLIFCSHTDIRKPKNILRNLLPIRNCMMQSSFRKFCQNRCLPLYIYSCSVHIDECVVSCPGGQGQEGAGTAGLPLLRDPDWRPRSPGLVLGAGATRAMTSLFRPHL
jgi:hypothetical protein